MTQDESEIVLVIKRGVLLDAHFRERVYWRRDGVPLPAGYYLVTWPDGAEKRIFNEDAAFRGPFKSREDAYAAAAKPPRMRRTPPSRAARSSRPRPY